MARVILCLGGAHNVWEDFEAAKRLCDDFDVGAVNEAGRDYRGNLALWATLHPEKLVGIGPKWLLEREKAGRNTDCAIVAHKARVGTRIDYVVPEFWSGSSGLYVCQVAAVKFGYDRIIVCGIPMAEEGHYFNNDPWRHASKYRRGWREGTDQPELKGKVRSMSGWTRELLGPPDPQWLEGGA